MTAVCHFTFSWFIQSARIIINRAKELAYEAGWLMVQIQAVDKARYYFAVFECIVIWLH